MSDGEVCIKINKEIEESAKKMWRRLDNFMHARHMMQMEYQNSDKNNVLFKICKEIKIKNYKKNQ